MKRRDALKRTTMLAGTAASAPALLSLLQSCAEQERQTWSPLFLDESQQAFITAFVGFLLPKTDTPGGLDVNVDVFLDRVFAEMYSPEAQQATVMEISNLNDRCTDIYGDVFSKISDSDKSAFLQSLEAESPKFNGSVWGTRVGEQPPVGFYRSLKSMALWGYFTSEPIGKNVLKYDPVPGEYLGCIPLSDVGGLWSL